MIMKINQLRKYCSMCSYKSMVTSEILLDTNLPFSRVIQLWSWMIRIRWYFFCTFGNNSYNTVDSLSAKHSVYLTLYHTVTNFNDPGQKAIENIWMSECNTVLNASLKSWSFGNQHFLLCLNVFYCIS